MVETEKESVAENISIAEEILNSSDEPNIDLSIMKGDMIMETEKKKRGRI